MTVAETGYFILVLTLIVYILVLTLILTLVRMLVCVGASVCVFVCAHKLLHFKIILLLIIKYYMTVLRLHKKELYRKLMQILNDPTHPMRHYFDSRHSNRSGRVLLPRTNTNHCFYLWHCQFLMKIIPVINWVCACIKTSVEDDNFLREGWGFENLIIFI